MLFCKGSFAGIISPNFTFWMNSCFKLRSTRKTFLMPSCSDFSLVNTVIDICRGSLPCQTAWTQALHCTALHCTLCSAQHWPVLRAQPVGAPSSLSCWKASVPPAPEPLFCSSFSPRTTQVHCDFWGRLWLKIYAASLFLFAFYTFWYFFSI